MKSYQHLICSKPALSHIASFSFSYIWPHHKETVTDEEVEELYNVAKTKALISGYLATNLHLYFRNMQKAGFLMTQLICDPVPFTDIH